MLSEEEDVWVEVVPEWAMEMEVEIEESYGIEDKQVVVERGEGGFVLLIGEEVVAREVNGNVQIRVGKEWTEAREESVDKEVLGLVYKAGGDYYKWYDGEGWKELEPVLITDINKTTIQEGENLVFLDKPLWNFMTLGNGSSRYNLWRSYDRPNGRGLFGVSSSLRLKGLAAILERKVNMEDEEREYLRFLVSHPVSPENEEPFLFQVRVPIEHIMFDFYWEGDYKSNVAFTGKHEEFLIQVRGQVQAGFGFGSVSFSVVEDCDVMDRPKNVDIYNLYRSEEAYIPRCKEVLEKYEDEMPKNNQEYVEHFMQWWNKVYKEAGVKGLEEIEGYYEWVEGGGEWQNDERIPWLKPADWVMISVTLEATDRSRPGYYYED